ncbi:hypothetical protein AAHA92_05805 [Salvia divinorum]|uniref:Myb/SANT-like domain-containing protein n=1 Tax=Salvia divinorum TaxID=28513 RepID=A0ABD1I3K1_SALDI
MNFPPQYMFFYKGKWTPEMDTILVDTLLRLKGETSWILEEFPSYFLLTAAKEIEEKEHVLLYEIELSNRVEALHTRYLAFKDLLAQKGAYWDFRTKSVIAPEAAWEKMCKKTRLAGAYFYEEEPQYNKLACLFGMDHIKVEGEKEVIVISESTKKKSDEEPSCYEIDDAYEEVTSPTAKRAVCADRKPFIDVDEPTNRESTTEPGIYFIDVAVDGQLRTSLEKGRALPKVKAVNTPGVGPSNPSSHASSCGSNSPIGWWPHLQK